ncbi:hypothetical protein [Sinomonas terrae]|uniref:Uncharacterized protein n=1 Tax=Sinomonas terrae TaxID=2908838 RepID=A0ABS9U6W2_9MICC|nr:hypothetical protein [Sinomonas terrae]MCH6472414.1 hypothetical protein [Sinomonas terrae]
MNNPGLQATWDTLMNIAPSLVAVVASAVSIVVAVDQLTQRARMRRLAEWAKDLAEGEADPNRSAVLLQVQRWAAGYALATVMVPARLFLEATITCFGVTVVQIAVGASSSGTPVMWPAAVAGFVSAWLPLRRALRSYLERYRIASEYFRGIEVAAPKLSILFQMEGGTRSEFVTSAVLAAGIVVVGVGAGVMLGNETQYGLMLLVIGLSVSGLGLTLVRRIAPPMLHAANRPHSKLWTP